jgi:hypothetical protein
MMMPLQRAEFEGLVADQSRLIALANELEYCLYAVGDRPDDEPVTACRQAAGALLGALRAILFRHDQTVLPLLESLMEDRPLRPDRSHPEGGDILT